MIETRKLKVGYDKKVIIDDIELRAEPGKILTLIGPNGSGKSTILKTITRQLKSLGGTVILCGKDMGSLSDAEVSKLLSMVMTERPRPELMTCRDVVATGRYPYTGRLGILSQDDWKKVDEAIEKVSAQEVADREFTKISDGQRQRIMLARAICQDTDIIVLDEPTSFLDMRYKLDLLKQIRRMAVDQNKTVIMSLHELDLAKAVSDVIACVDGDRISRIGSPEEIYSGNFIQRLFGVDDDEFDEKTGCMILKRE